MNWKAGKAFFAEYGIPREVLSHPVDSIYIGGGTPTLLGEERLGLVVRALQDHLRWSEDIEFTLETTPGSADCQLASRSARPGREPAEHRRANV